MKMTGQEPPFNRYVVDTNIVIYTLKGIEQAVAAMDKFEDDDIEVYYSTIVEAELFSFHELTEEESGKIRAVLDLGEIVYVDSEVALKAAELRLLSRKTYQRKLKLPDAIVAATALVYSAVLVTRNIEDFDHLKKHDLLLWNPLDAIQQE
jgi:predicted nucleic acid-binding protein